LLAVAPAPLQAASPATQSSAETKVLLDYLQAQNTTGFLVIQNGKVLIERNWPVPDNAPMLRAFAYERNAEGALLEDVASQQKSFVSVLVAVAVDKGLIDVTRPVSDYIGPGWSKAPQQAEHNIRVVDLLTMSSGLNEKFEYQAPAGTTFFYNTPVYAVTKRILTAAAKRPLDAITREWLTIPTGMKDTAWRERPAALANVGNSSGLVTSPRDIARFGAMILNNGVSESGTRVVSANGVAAMLAPSPVNPAYGRLWWRNGGAYSIGSGGVRKEGALVPTAPADMVAALGALDRRLYIVPSRRLIVVRTGAAALDADFDKTLWELLERFK